MLALLLLYFLGWWIFFFTFWPDPLHVSFLATKLSVLDFLICFLFFFLPLFVSKHVARAALSLARGSDGVPILSWFPYPIPPPLYLNGMLMVDVDEIVAVTWLPTPQPLYLSLFVFCFFLFFKSGNFKANRQSFSFFFYFFHQWQTTKKTKKTKKKFKNK